MTLLLIILAAILYMVALVIFARSAYRRMRLISRRRYERAVAEWGEEEAYKEYIFEGGPAYPSVIATTALLISPLWPTIWPVRLLFGFLMADAPKSPGELAAERNAHEKHVKALMEEIRQRNRDIEELR